MANMGGYLSKISKVWLYEIYKKMCKANQLQKIV